MRRVLSYIAFALVMVCIAAIHFLSWAPSTVHETPGLLTRTLEAVAILAAAALLIRSKRRGPARLWVAVLPLLVISAYLVVTEVVPALNAVRRWIVERGIIDPALD